MSKINNTNFTRDCSEVSIKALKGEGNERKFTISFSSETPYQRWFGNEILSHSDGCIDLNRLSEIGCVLYNHNRDAVIGKVTRVWIENNRGCADIEFDSDDESEKIYQKVKSGTLKGVSVGYRVDVYEEVAEGKKSTDGRFNGPAYVATRWVPYEVSIVSVPADETVGVGREMEKFSDNHQNTKSLSVYEWQLKINQNNRR